MSFAIPPSRGHSLDQSRSFCGCWCGARLFLAELRLGGSCAPRPTPPLGAVERDEREASTRGGHEPQPRLPGLSHLLVVLQVIHEVGYDALEQLLRAVRALRLLLTSLTLLTGLTLTLRLALLHEPLQHLQHLGRRVVDRSLLPLTLTLRLALALGVTSDG